MTEREAELVAAIEKTIEALRAFLPPDGLSAKECVSRILAAVDNPKVNEAVKAAKSAKGFFRTVK